MLAGQGLLEVTRNLFLSPKRWIGRRPKRLRSLWLHSPRLPFHYPSPRTPKTSGPHAGGSVCHDKIEVLRLEVADWTPSERFSLHLAEVAPYIDTPPKLTSKLCIDSIICVWYNHQICSSQSAEKHEHQV